MRIIFTLLGAGDLPVLRFIELAGQNLFVHKPLAELDKPPNVNPSNPQPKCYPAQLAIAYA
jgi:putative transposase